MDYNKLTTLEFRRKFFKLFGAEITVTNPLSDSVVGFISMKAWTLREDIRLYTDQHKQHELLRLHARQIIDFAATYDVFKDESDTISFSLRRKGVRSTFVRDHWLITANDQPLAELVETSSALAIARRWVGIIPFVGEILDIIFAFAPQTYRLQNNDGKLLATIVHRKNPFIVKMNYDASQAEAKPADPFIGPAMCALLSTIDASK